jgi:hypothetical protein
LTVGSCLKHESESSQSTSEAETGLDGRASVGGGLRQTRGGGVGRTGVQRRGDGHGARGLDGVVAGGDTSADDNGGALGHNGGWVGSNRLVDLGGGRCRGAGSDAGRRRRSRVSVGGGAGAGAGNRRKAAGRRDDSGAVASRDTKLGAVLVLAGYIVDDLDAVAERSAVGGREVHSGGPDEATAVGDALSERGTELDNVGRRALEQENGDGVGGGWLPCDGEGLASGDNLVGLLARCSYVWFHDNVLLARRAQCQECAYLVQGLEDGVASGLTNGSVDLRSGEAGEEGDDGSLGVHVDGIVGIM